MNIVGIIQARMGSKRLPGKVLAHVHGYPMLYYVVGRAYRAAEVHKWIVATTERQEDDAIEAWCTSNGISVFRGDAYDVLKRYADAAAAYHADVVVRVTADCPLLDPEVVDLVVRRFLEENVCYASNVTPPTYPDGLDIEVFNRDVLDKVHKEADTQYEREHITQYIRSRPGEFPRINVRRFRNLSHLRWTVDEPEDLEVVQQVYARLDNPWSNHDKVLSIFKQNPELGLINARFERNHGRNRSKEVNT